MDEGKATALDFLAERVAQTGPGERPAVVLDIDEVALLNLPHMRAFDFGYAPPEWDAWVMRGEAPVNVPVPAFFQAARHEGVEVFSSPAARRATGRERRKICGRSGLVTTRRWC